MCALSGEKENNMLIANFLEYSVNQMALDLMLYRQLIFLFIISVLLYIGAIVNSKSETWNWSIQHYYLQIYTCNKTTTNKRPLELICDKITKIIGYTGFLLYDLVQSAF